MPAFAPVKATNSGKKRKANDQGEEGNNSPAAGPALVAGPSPTASPAVPHFSGGFMPHLSRRPSRTGYRHATGGPERVLPDQGTQKCSPTRRARFRTFQSAEEAAVAYAKWWIKEHGQQPTAAGRPPAHPAALRRGGVGLGSGLGVGFGGGGSASGSAAAGSAAASSAATRRCPRPRVRRRRRLRHPHCRGGGGVATAVDGRGGPHLYRRRLRRRAAAGGFNSSTTAGPTCWCSLSSTSSSTSSSRRPPSGSADVGRVVKKRLEKLKNRRGSSSSGFTEASYRIKNPIRKLQTSRLLAATWDFCRSGSARYEGEFPDQGAEFQAHAQEFC